MMNLTSSSDRSGPVQYVDTAYDALKYNVPATQQVMQAAQQGQPVGLAGLGAMAAQKFQQQAQQGQQAQQAQQTAMAPSPTVLAQLLNSSGIMGQFQPNLELAQAPSDMPQQMAMGGIVALNEGGFIDYGYDGGEGYAYGGDVGLSSKDEDAEIEKEMEEEDYDAAVERATRGTAPQYPFGAKTEISFPEEEFPDPKKIPAVTYADVPIPSDKNKPLKEHGFFELPKEYKPRLEPLPSPEYWQRPGADKGRAEISQGLGAVLNPIGEKIDKLVGNFKENAGTVAKGFEKAKEYYGKAKKEWENEHEYADAAKTALGMGKAAADETPEETPKAKPSAKAKVPGVKPPNAAHHEENAKRKKYAGTRGTTTTPLVPAAAPVPGEDAIAEHQKVVDEASEASKRGALPPSSSYVPKPKEQAAPASSQTAAAPAGITSLPVGGELEELQKLYMGDITGELSPETASRLEAMQEQATRDKWLQTLTGAAAGLFGAETPYMSQAIASGAMKGLSAYQQGAQNEEQAELRMLQAQMAAEKEPREAQQKALATYIQAQMQQGKSAADIRKAMVIAQNKAEQLQFTEAGKNRRSAAQVGALTGLKEEEIRSRIEGTRSQIEARNIENMSKADKEAKDEIARTLPTPTKEQEQAIYQKWYRTYNIPTGAGTGYATGLGGGAGMGGRPLIMNTSGQIQ